MNTEIAQCVELWSLVRGPAHVLDDVWCERFAAPLATSRAARPMALSAFVDTGCAPPPRPRSVSLDFEPRATDMCFEWDRPVSMDGGALVCVVRRGGVRRRAVVMVRHDADTAPAAAMLALWTISSPTVAALDVVGVGDECRAAHGVMRGFARALGECNFSNHFVTPRLFCLGPADPVAGIDGVTIVCVVHAADREAVVPRRVSPRVHFVTVGAAAGARRRCAESASCCSGSRASSWGAPPPAALTPHERAELYAAALRVTDIPDV